MMYPKIDLFKKILYYLFEIIIGNAKFRMEHPVYSSYKVKQDGGEVFSENGWGGFGKSQLGAWGGAQRAARSDRRQYFDNAPAIDTGVARTRLTVEFPGGVAMVADGAPIETTGVSLARMKPLEG